MTKDLERDLGLPAVLAISIGAMVGSGIFILPGLALEMAGPGVVLAYLIAGLLVVPAALSKSEMATAMPEAGGTYIYIERAMGPLLGSIAGIGTWFALSFKGALALVGGVPYLVLVLDLPTKPVALGLAVVLIAINLVGAKQTGRLQIAIVVAMLAAMTWFVIGGADNVAGARFDGFFDRGSGGILAATGFVFVSYAGVTKVASIAEEIENPDRNIPLGILGSLGFTTLLYVGIVAVMVGVTPVETLAGSNVPVVETAELTLPSVGVIAVIIAALLALVSTANAGILSSSRYPFAMSRDGLAPASLNEISDRFQTPARAITLTGAVLLILIAFVPIRDIAKLASAFQILVFVLVNLAVVAFRAGDVEDYEPSFRTPLYPVPQIVGVLGGLALLPWMGLVPMLGALAITLGSLAWYIAFVRGRGEVEREGVAAHVMRQSVGRRVIAETESVVAEEHPYEVLVALTEQTAPETESTLVELAADLARSRDGMVRVVRFDEVPDQAPLERAAGELTPGDSSFESRIAERANTMDVPVEYGEIVSHDTRHAVVNHAATEDVDSIVLERQRAAFHTSVFGSEIDWIHEHAHCDVIQIEDRGLGQRSSLAVVTDRGPFDPVKVMIADGLATQASVRIEFLFAIDPSASARRRRGIREYLERLGELCTSPVDVQLVESPDRVDGIAHAARDADLLVASASPGGLRGALLGRPSDRIVEQVDCTSALVHAHASRGPGRVRRFIENRLF